MNIKVLAGIKQFDRSAHNLQTNSCSYSVMKDGTVYHERIGTSLWKISSRHASFRSRKESFDVSFSLTEGTLKSSTTCLEVQLEGWSLDHYLLLPGVAYNGNRFESRDIPYSPKLSEDSDIGKDVDIIISNIPRLNIRAGESRIQDRSGALTVPLIGIYDPHARESLFIEIPRHGKSGDTGFSIRENSDRTCLRIEILSPVVREKTQYTLTNNNAPSGDVPPDLEQGYLEYLKMQMVTQTASNLQAFFRQFFVLRSMLKDYSEKPLHLPFSLSFPLQEKKFNLQNWVEDPGYYSVGMRENFLQDWQIGWTGGMITTYPLLTLGSKTTRKRVINNIDWVLREGISPSGFFWDSGEKGRNWYGGDIRHEHTRNWHLVRKSGDALFYLVKQFRLLDSRGEKIPDDWKSSLQRVADTFVQLWNREGQLGQFVDSQTGAVIVGGSTSGAIVPAALVLCSSYFGKGIYLDVAAEIAKKYYKEFISRGITCGGPGDALQCPDSESAYAMLESFLCLFESGHQGPWLEYARNMAHQFSSWVCSYDYAFPTDSMLGSLGVYTRGCVAANVQNKHGAPGICTYSGSALLRLTIYTGDQAYASLLEEIVSCMPQFLSRPDRRIPGLADGWISERVSTTDWFEGIGEIMTGSTWAETSLMLCCTELPGLYLNKEGTTLFCFDQLKASLQSRGSVQIYNHTEARVTTTIMHGSESIPGDLWPVDPGRSCLHVSIDPKTTLNLKFQ